jgi:putative transposase
MSAKDNTPKIPLPKSWPDTAKSAMLHVLSLAHFAMAYTRGWAANCINDRIRMKARSDLLEQKLASLTEEICIKDARIATVDPRNRPHYPATERMAILLLRAANGWSLKQTAKRFLVTPATIASWVKRVDEQGPNALVQLREPVNKFPELVRYAVQQLKALCPSLGKVKIAQMLCRAGLHLGKTTVGRILKEKPVSPAPPATEDTTSDEEKATERIVKANYPNHVWAIDLTTVPLFGGFWASWFPNAFFQRWPFCWWVAVVVDYYSRRAMGFMIFRKQPSSRAVQEFLDRTIQKNGAKPKYTITDKGGQFWCPKFKGWCKSHQIKPRFGAVGQYGSIAVVERFIRTLKDEYTRLLDVPSRRRDFRAELACFIEYYNEWRPHSFLRGKAPNEAYHKRHPACRYPRFEPRPRWPRGVPCAAPRVPVRGKPGVRLTLQVTYHGGRKPLPIVTLRHAA